MEAEESADAATSTEQQRLCTHEGCTNPTRTARSKYCEEHSPRRFPQPDSSGLTDGARHRRAADIETALRTNLLLVAQMWSIHDPECAGALRDSAPQIAAYWADQARNSERIAKTLEAVTTSGGWMAGIAAHAPLLVAVFEHHLRPALEARQHAAPSGNGQFAEGQRAYNTETGEYVEWRDGEWQPVGAAEPPEQAGEQAGVDRWGHGPGDAGTPVDDASGYTDDGPDLT